MTVNKLYLKYLYLKRHLRQITLFEVDYCESLFNLCIYLILGEALNPKQECRCEWKKHVINLQSLPVYTFSSTFSPNINNLILNLGTFYRFKKDVLLSPQTPTGSTYRVGTVATFNRLSRAVYTNQQQRPQENNFKHFI